MPIYSYKCLECENVFDIFHSMSEVPETCKVCNTRGQLEKQVPKSTNISKARNFGKPKVGTVVKKYIKEVTQELKEEKKRLKSKEYDQ